MRLLFLPDIMERERERERETESYGNMLKVITSVFEWEKIELIVWNLGRS